MIEDATAHTLIGHSVETSPEQSRPSAATP
jgi:hypothetical protein